jgi:heme-degrading monooxygenase HmoA
VVAGDRDAAWRRGAGEVFMIIRVWMAPTTEEDQHKYYKHFRSQVLPALHRLDGYEGASLSSRRSHNGVEILVMTRWRSLEAVRAFAGPDAEQAVVADEAARVLKNWDASVKHYETVLEDAGR